MSQPTLAIWFAYGAVFLLVVAAAWDVVTLTIPNFLVVAVLVLYAASAVVNFDLSDLLFDLLAGAIVFAVGFAFFALGWLGGGDAKLAPGAVLWVGFDGLLPFVVVMTLAGGVLAVTLIILRAAARRIAPQERLPMVLRWTGPVPYGVAIGVGAIVIIGLQNRAVLAL